MQQRRIPNRFRHPGQRALIRRQQPDVQLLNVDPGIGGGPAHVNGAQRVKQESKRYAMHCCYHRSGDEGRCGDDDLKVVEMCANWGRATP